MFVFQIKRQKFDGLIITGAPIEHLPFEEVNYWDELKSIMDWADSNVSAMLYICWGAQAALYHRHGIPKYPLDHKMFGVFEHRVLQRDHRLFRGFDDVYLAPHSRHTEIRREDLEQVAELEILSDSTEAGIYIVGSKDCRHIYVTGHSEYDPLTLKGEYDRDVAKNLPINVPANYYPGNDPSKEPVVRWRSHANLLFSNWLNYFVYQVAPSNLRELSHERPLAQV